MPSPTCAAITGALVPMQGRRLQRAEIEFGLNNSEMDSADLLALIDSFMQQDDAWVSADRDLRDAVSEKEQAASLGSVELEASVYAEVLAWQAAFRGDLDGAAAYAREAADRLQGTAIGPYRCFWLYLAAS